jgi:hypothetical protein
MALAATEKAVLGNDFPISHGSAYLGRQLLYQKFLTKHKQNGIFCINQQPGYFGDT